MDFRFVDFWQILDLKHKIETRFLFSKRRNKWHDCSALPTSGPPLGALFGVGMGRAGHGLCWMGSSVGNRLPGLISSPWHYLSELLSMSIVVSTSLGGRRVEMLSSECSPYTGALFLFTRPTAQFNNNAWSPERFALGVKGIMS